MNLLLTRLAKLYPKSLIAEFCRLFGEESTKKLLMVFGGTTLRIPSTKEILKTQRDLQIYEELEKAKDPKDFRITRKTIEARYGLSKRRVKDVYKEMAKLHKEGEKIHKSDKEVGQHKKRRSHRKH